MAGAARSSFAGGVNPLTEFDSRTGLVHQSAGDHVSFFVLGKIFIDARGNELLHAELHLAFLGIDADDEDLHDLADAQDFSGRSRCVFPR